MKTHPHLANLKRPALLVRAARLAAENLHRKPMLRKVFGEDDVPPNALPELSAIESELNTRRKTGDAGYSIARHVTVLAALMHEAALGPT